MKTKRGLEALKSCSDITFDQAIYSKSDQLVMTSGTQQALFILSQIDFPSRS